MTAPFSLVFLVIGSGGREHAIAWKLAASDLVARVFVAPGNAGSATEAKVENIALSDFAALADFARTNGVTHTVVGPEAPLAEGIVDFFRAQNLPILGPGQYCAQLESSKEFAKQFMLDNAIPTARYQSFSDADSAHDYVEREGAPIVIKADGLAAGKGVVVATTLAEAHRAIDDMLRDNSLGNAGRRLVIEQFLAGEEASFIVLCDGENALPLATSQDHKRLLDNDRGPNTGGMGAYSPAPVVTPAVHQRVMQQIIQPVLTAMAANGTPYTGFLYAGLMIDDAGQPSVVEFNCRLGDPETQPVLMRLQSDFASLLVAAIDARLHQQAAATQWDSRSALGVVLAAAGYPGSAVRSGDVIDGLAAANSADCHVFHAATVAQENAIHTSGGRVLCVTALGEDLARAQEAAYAQVAKIHFEGCQYRRDIGQRGL